MKKRPRTLRLLLSLVLAVGLIAGFATTAKADEPKELYEFSLAYDCQRLPFFPTTGKTCTLYYPNKPVTGYHYEDGEPNDPVADRMETNEGAWTLSYLMLYKDMDEGDVNTDMKTVATDYSNNFNLITKDNVPVFELKKDGTHVAFGLLWATLDINSEPAVFFVGDTFRGDRGGGGYVLSNQTVTHLSIATVTQDLPEVKKSFVGVDIAVSGGGHAIKSGGATEQSGLTGAIEQLNYKADDGFHFAQFDDKTENGITVHWVSRSEVTVSGTPTRDTRITVPDAQADPAKKPTPEAMFTATDYDRGTLSNVKAGQQYRIDAGEWIDVPSDAAIDLTGVSPCTIEVIERGDGETALDSDIETIVVTRAAVPTGPAATDCTTLANDDGKLVGVTENMQYKAPGDDEWTPGDGSDVEGLKPSTYLVRTRPAGTVLASENLPLTVRALVSHTVKFKVVNGAWSDGTTDEKSVTLTGHDGDVLKLSESQIPKAGTNPNSGYREGSWDTTPSTETEIDKDTVYTYAYEEFSYSCTDGDGSSWTKGSKDGLPLTFKRSDEDQSHEAFTHFKSVMVDGKEIKDSDYTVSKGDGVVVTLTSSFLSTLGSGEHTLTSIFDDGAAEGKFSVAEPADDKELFTLTFVPNGGQVYDSTAAVQKTYEGGTVITMPEPTRDGYRFLYWEGSQYYAGQEYTVTENHTFTAQWEKDDPAPATHTITFNANGGTGEMPAMTATEGLKAKLSPNKLKRDGYTFAGWNTKADGTGTAYADQAEVEVKDDIVLYAQWKKNATPKAAVRNTTTTKTLPKTGEADLGAMAALLGAMAAAALLASRAVKE